MPDFYAEPDFEELAVSYLKATAAVTALVPAASISTKLRRGWSAGDPALRVRRIGGLPTEQAAQHLVRGVLQVEAYAGTEVDAHAIIGQADLALRRMPSSSFTGAVVTDVRKRSPIRNDPDPDSDSARFLFDAVLYAHGIPE